MQLTLAIVITGAVIAYLLIRRKPQDGAGALLSDLQRREQESSAEIARLRADLEQARLGEARAQSQSVETLKRLDEERQFLALAEQRLKEAFEALAGKALSASSEEFHQRLERSLGQSKGELEQQLESRKVAVEEMVRPLKEQLESLRRYGEEVSRQQKGSDEGLRGLMKTLEQGQEKLAAETGRLSQALRSNQSRGQWGEMVLEKMLLWTGLKEGVHFEKQVQRSDDEKGTVKPDFIVHLPGKRDIVIDSKAVLAAYIDAEGESDPQRKAELLKQHARNVSATVDNLSRKGYAEQFQHAPDFVVLFMPADAFLFAALEVDRDIFERAFQKNVILATPSTLIPMLRIIERSWAVSSMADNAKEISKQGQELMNRFTTFWDHLGDLRGNIEGVAKSFNSALASLQARVIPAAKRLGEMGVKSEKASKAGNIKPIDTVVDEPQGAPESLNLN